MPLGVDQILIGDKLLTVSETNLFIDGTNIAAGLSGVSTIDGNMDNSNPLVNTDGGVSTRFIVTTYNNTNTFGSSFRGKRARGTIDNPSGLLHDDVLLQLVGDGYKGDGYRSAAGSFVIKASGDWTPDTQASYVLIRTSPASGTAQLERLRINPDGKVGICQPNPQYGLDLSGNANFSQGVYWGGEAVVRSSDINLNLGYSILKSGETITGLTYNNGKAVQIFRSGDYITGTFDGTYRKSILYDGEFNITGVSYST